MFSTAFMVVDWFIPARSRLSKSELGRARTFVFTHLIGPASGVSIVAFLFVADPSPGFHVPLIGAGIAVFWLLCLVLRVSGSLPLVAIVSVQTLIAVTLIGAYNYGGVSSPFLAWLLIALANGFFYLSDRPLERTGDFRPECCGFYRGLVRGRRSSQPHSHGADVECRHRVRQQRNPLHGLAGDLLWTPP